MRVPLRAIGFALILAFFSIPAAASPVAGRVVDPDGRAVRGATIMLVDGTSVVATTHTDEGGAFSFDTPREGAFEIHVAADGFRARPAAVRSGGEPVTITLAVSAVRESVVVSAAQADIPLSTTSSSVTVLTAGDLEGLQIHSLADALRLAPGLTVAAAGTLGAQTSIFPRGGESDYSLVFVDGVQANAFGGGFDAAHLPLAGIERVEIVRGPQSALYGSNAIGSVVRIVTRRGGPLLASGSVEAGSFGTYRTEAAASGTGGAWQWGGSFERTSSDGVVDNDDYNRHTIAGSVRWAGSNGAALNGGVHYTDDERGFPGPYGTDPGGTFEGLDLGSRGSNDRWLASLNGAAPIAGRVHVTGQIAHGRIEGDVVSFAGRSFTTSRRTGGRLQADIRVLPALQASAGGELQTERAGSTFITAAGSREVPVDRTLAGLFSEARWSHRGRLFVTGGIRVERIARHALPGNPDAFSPRPDFVEDTITSANPKIGAAWFVRSSDGSFTKLRASAGTGIRPPDAFEIAFTDNPSLKPERSRSVDAGVDQAFAGGRASIEGTVFYNRYDDLIVAVGSFNRSSRYRTDNISNARAYGVELSGTARARIPWSVPIDLHIRAGLTLLDTEILAVDGASGAPPPFEPGDRLLRRPARQFSSEVLVTAGRFSGFVAAGGRSRSLDVDPSFGTFGGLFEAPGYAVVHAGGRWRVTRAIEAFGRVTNLFDRTYEEALGFPALGRAGMLGLRVAAGR